MYWIEDRTGELSRIARGGGVREHVADGVGSGWASIASDEEHLFVPRTDAQIHRLTLDGREDVALSAFGGERVSAIQVLRPHVYWHSSTGDPGRGNFAADVRRVNVDGFGAAEVLWRSRPFTFSSGFAIGGGYIFVDVFSWSYPNKPQSDGQILRLSSTTGAVVPLVTGLLGPQVHGADDRYVYFSAQNLDRHNELWRVPILDESPELVQSGTFEAWVDVGQMLIQADTVWWQVRRGAATHLYRASSSGGVPVPVVTVDAPHMFGLAGDGRYLYFSSRYSFDAIGPAAIWRIGRQCPTD